MTLRISQKNVSYALPLASRKPGDHEGIAEIENIVYPHWATCQKDRYHGNTALLQRSHAGPLCALVIPSDRIDVTLHLSIRRLTENKDRHINLCRLVSRDATSCRLDLLGQTLKY